MDIRVRTVQADNGSISDNLGMTPERHEELTRLTAEAFRRNLNVTDTMEQVSEYCKHPNELAYASYLIGKMHLWNELGHGTATDAADALERSLKSS